MAAGKGKDVKSSTILANREYLLQWGGLETKTVTITLEEVLVSKKSNTEKLAKIKVALAEKYERLAKITPSVPRRATMLRHAKSYRRQAELLAR